MNTACSNCGHEECWPEDRFCVKCGRRLSGNRAEGQDAATVTMKVADAAYVQVKLGNVYRKRGNTDAATRAYKKALEIDANCAAAHAALREMQTESGAASTPATGTDR